LQRKPAFQMPATLSHNSKSTVTWHPRNSSSAFWSKAAPLF